MGLGGKVNDGVDLELLDDVIQKLKTQEISLDEFIVGLVCNSVVVVDACAIVELVVVQKENVGYLFTKSSST